MFNLNWDRYLKTLKKENLNLRYEQYVNKILMLIDAKNRGYKDSYKKQGLIGIVLRIKSKLDRFKTIILENNSLPKKKKISTEDTLQDLAAYSLFYVDLYLTDIADRDPYDVDKTKLINKAKLSDIIISIQEYSGKKEDFKEVVMKNKLPKFHRALNSLFSSFLLNYDFYYSNYSDEGLVKNIFDLNSLLDKLILSKGSVISINEKIVNNIIQHIFLFLYIEFYEKKSFESSLKGRTTLAFKGDERGITDLIDNKGVVKNIDPPIPCKDDTTYCVNCD